MLARAMASRCATQNIPVIRKLMTRATKSGRSVASV